MRTFIYDYVEPESLILLTEKVNILCPYKVYCLAVPPFSRLSRVGIYHIGKSRLCCCFEKNLIGLRNFCLANAILWNYFPNFLSCYPTLNSYSIFICTFFYNSMIFRRHFILLGTRYIEGQKVITYYETGSSRTVPKLGGACKQTNVLVSQS